MRILLATIALVAAVAPPVFAADGAPSATTPQARTLESDEFARYMLALDSVMAVRADAEKEFLADPAKGQDATAAAALMKKATAAMESNGFTNESFNLVHWNVMQAFAQLEIQANSEDVEATLVMQREELAAAKDKLPADQYDVAAKRLERTEALLKGFGGVPAKNIDLVRTNLADLKATFERGMGGAKTGYQKPPKAAAK